MTNTAQTILKQIGGANRVSAMTGAKNFIDMKTGLRFDLPRGLKVTIGLNSADLYDVDVSKFNARTLGMTNKAFVQNVSVEQLKSVLEKATGLRFSL
jgi:hypothetical protein